MKRKLFYYLSFTILCLNIPQFLIARDGWYSVSAGYEYGHYGVFFINTQKGFVTTEGGSIMVTNNGGNSWTDLHLYNDNHPSDLFFINNNIGWMACWDTRIYMTKDGGRTWGLMIEDTSGQTTTNMSILYSVHFANESIGCAVGFSYNMEKGYSPIVIKTIDGGINWEYQNVTQNGKVLFSVFYTDDTTGWICGQQGYLIYTEDGGHNWIQKDLGTYSDFSSLFFIDSMHGWIAGSGGIIYRTVDAGENWVICDNPSYAQLLSVHFADSSNGYACGAGGTILKTTNGGASWDQQISGTGNGLTNIFAVTADTVYCVGRNGTILKTTNGGVGGSGVISQHGEKPEVFKIFPNYPNPFNPSTVIPLQINEMLNGPVILRIYDLRGNLVRTRVMPVNGIGQYVFNLEWDADLEKILTSGIYFYNVEYGNKIQSGKVCLIR